MLLGVEDLVLDLDLVEQPGQVFRGLDRGRADQHRLAAGDAIANVVDDRVEFFALGQVDQVAEILADHRHVGRDDDDLEAVDLLELEGLGIGGAGHAGEFFVEAEIVLERDRRDRLVFVLDAHALLGLDRLVQAVRPAPARHHAAGELVDDDDVAVLDEVLDVAVVERVRAQTRIEVMNQGDVAGVVEALALLQQAGLDQQSLGGVVAFLGEKRLA